MDSLVSNSAYWPWWAGALALAAIAVLHFVFERRLFGVSGSMSRTLDAARGQSAAVDPCGGAARSGVRADLVFLLMVPVGAVLASLINGSFAIRLDLGPTLDRLYGAGAPTLLTLVLGGALVGFGTRLAKGCTSGHGLCGTSRLQPGSLVATATFFGTGIVVAHLLEAVLS